MMLDISAAFRSPGSAIPFEHMEDLPDTETLGERVVFPEPALIKGTFSLVDDSLVIKGRLTASAKAACARCLSPVKYTVDVPVDESFQQVDPGVETEDDPWEERLVFSGKAVDLSQLAMTLAVLDLPIRFLCRENCAGINDDVTGEDPAPNEETLDDAHPFGALRQLFTNFQEE